MSALERLERVVRLLKEPPFEAPATITEQVTEFHKAFDFPIRDEVQLSIDEGELRFRAMLITEEYLEYMAASGFDIDESVVHALHLSPIKHSYSVVEMADALGDMDYINEGTRLTFGIPRQKVADEIQRSNMAKVGGRLNEYGKLMKPDGWTPPDLTRVLLTPTCEEKSR